MIFRVQSLSAYLRLFQMISCQARRFCCNVFFTLNQRKRIDYIMCDNFGPPSSMLYAVPVNKILWNLDFTYEEERERGTQVILLICQNCVVDDKVKTCLANILLHISYRKYRTKTMENRKKCAECRVPAISAAVMRKKWRMSHGRRRYRWLRHQPQAWF